MKETRGVTLISLIVTIAIIIILAGVSIFAGANSIKDANVTKFNTELKIIHAKVNEIAEEKRTEEELNTLGQTIDTLSSEIRSKMNVAMQGKSTEGFRYFNKVNLERIGVSGIDREVIINFRTREVVDINGVKKGESYIYRVEGWTNIEYENKNTEAPDFTLSKKVYGLKCTIVVENIEYKGNVRKGQVSYCLFENNTEGTWNKVSGTEFTVEQSGIYKVRLTDAAGNITEKTVEVVLVNQPKLDSGMTPVVYDETISKWKKVSAESGNWYDYASDKKQWANVMLQDGLVVNADGTIDNDKMGSMFVWVPRYMYQIVSGYHLVANGTGTINIKFLKGTTNIATDGSNVRISTASGQGNWLTHPAFTEGNIGKEISGMWVGKFESSNASSPYNNEGIETTENYKKGLGDGVTKNVAIKPNVTSWRWTDVVTMYNVCQAMNKIGNTYGLTSETDTMLMKNSQWGAVAYLAQSNYGNKQGADNQSGIWNNPYQEGYIYINSGNEYGMGSYCTTLTGMAGESRDISTNYNAKVKENSKIDNGDSITITYNNIEKVAEGGGPNGTLGSEFTRTFYRYNTEIGQRGSTTRNVYGIYDMSGGSWEYMASFLSNSTNSYVTTMKTKPSKYTEEYAGSGATSSTADRTANYEANKEVYGDAVYETSNGANGGYSWNGDDSYFPYLSSPFFIRGGNFGNASTAGVFYFFGAYGGSGADYGFRAVAL